MTTGKDLRSKMAAGAARARTTDDPQLVELAQAVETVLAPGGWVQLRDTDSIKPGSTPLQMKMAETDRDLIKARCKNIAADVNEGFARYLAGEFTPRPYVRSHGMWGASKGSRRVTLNTRSNEALTQQVRETGLLPSYVAAEYLMSKHRVGPYALGRAEERRPRGDERIPYVPAALRDEFRARAEAAGRTVTDDVNEGFERFLAGGFTPSRLPWKVAGNPQEAGLVHLKIHPDNGLYEQVRQVARERSAELGWTPTPLQVALSYLLHKYGIEAE